MTLLRRWKPVEEVSLDDDHVGRQVQISYDGSLAESYPAQIWGQKIQLVE